MWCTVIATLHVRGQKINESSLTLYVVSDIHRVHQSVTWINRYKCELNVLAMHNRLVGSMDSWPWSAVSSRRKTWHVLLRPVHTAGRRGYWRRSASSRPVGPCTRTDLHCHPAYHATDIHEYTRRSRLYWQPSHNHHHIHFRYHQHHQEHTCMKLCNISTTPRQTSLQCCDTVGWVTGKRVSDT